jgi:K+/H+ antiporter YhaU regulatory subunit KhtT
MIVGLAIRKIFLPTILPVLSAGMLLLPVISLAGAGQKVEKHFIVKGRPVVMIQNVADGRIEVKSWKNSEVVVTASQPSDKVGLDMEQADDRIDVIANILDTSAPQSELSENIQLTVPEQTELQIKTQTGLIYVEQVIGDMKLESVAGDVHLKEVSGYIIVHTTGGSFVCTQCAGKLDFNTISGSAQILQPSLKSVNLITTTGNILFDGDFIRTGIYTMKSGRGLVEVRFSGADSFDLNAQTSSGTVDNRAEAFLKPDTHGFRRSASKYAKGLFGTVGNGLAKVELSSFSGTVRILKRD